MVRILRKIGIALFLGASLWLVLTSPLQAKAKDSVASFAARNLNPFIQVYGLPPVESGNVQKVGKQQFQFLFDIANNSRVVSTTSEAINIDGETYRWALLWRMGIREGVEVGLELPYIAHRNGVMDNFIERWHDSSNQTNSQRDDTPSNRLDYRYFSRGNEITGIKAGSSGIGDVRIFAAKSLFRDLDKKRYLSTRVSLKLPTGDEHQLQGSGGSDLALSLNVTDDSLFSSQRETIFAQVGILFLEKGDVLPSMQRKRVFFGSAGLNWAVSERADFIMQLDGHSSFYQSKLDVLGDKSVLLTVGGTFYLDSGVDLSLGIGENLFTDTIPDVQFNIAISIQK